MLDLIARIPTLSLVVLLISVIVYFLIDLFPKNLLYFESRGIAIIILGILPFLYGIRLRKLQINKEFQYLYWCINTILAVVMILSNNKKIIVFNLLVWICSVLNFEPKFQSISTYFQRSRNALVAFNIFDAVFITICLLLKNNSEKIDEFLKKIPIDWIDIVQWILIILISIAIPFLRGFISIYFYKKQNDIYTQQDKVYWFSNLKAYVISIVSIYLYLNSFFQNSTSDLFKVILLYLILMSLTAYFWTIVYEGIDRGGEDKEIVLSYGGLLVLLLSFVVFLDKIESDFLGMLTWFLPISIPIFIGEVNMVVPGGDSKIPTYAMKKHLYWLQIMSFNTLLLLNIFSSMSVSQVIKKGEIKEYNIYKNFMVRLWEEYLPSTPVIGIYVSFMILIFAIFFAYLLSKLMIYLIKRVYLETSNKYFR